MIERSEIEKLGILSRIALSEEEKDAFVKEIDSILTYVGRVKDAPLSGSQSASMVSDVFREDGEPHETGLFTERIVTGMPSREGNYLKVKKILPS